MRRIGATCTAAPKRMRCKSIAAREYDRKGGGIRRRRRVLVGMASLASQRPTARVAAGGSAKLRLPTCDRRHQHTLSAKTCAVSAHMSGKRRSSTLATKLGELVADSFRTNGKRTQTMHIVDAAQARRFRAASRAGRAAPATCGKRVPPADEGVVKRGRASAQSRRTYSSTGPPAGFTSESAGRDRWPPPSDKVTERSYEKNESVVHATPLDPGVTSQYNWYCI